MPPRRPSAVAVLALLTALAAVPAAPSAGRAQAAPSAVGGRDALTRLSPLVGRWTMASLPPGVRLVETCEWFVGERHVVCQMRSESTDWRRGALTIFSWDPVDSTYAMTAIGSGGQRMALRGPARGDTLDLEGELTTGTEHKRIRVRIVPRADGFDLTEQEADGRGGWAPAAAVRYVPAREGR